MIDHFDSTASVNLVAIDVAKDWNVVLIQDVAGNRRSFKVANKRVDHDRFVAFLKSLPGRVRIRMRADRRLPSAACVPFTSRRLRGGHRVFGGPSTSARSTIRHMGEE